MDDLKLGQIFSGISVALQALGYEIKPGTCKYGGPRMTLWANGVSLQNALEIKSAGELMDVPSNRHKSNGRYNVVVGFSDGDGDTRLRSFNQRTDGSFNFEAIAATLSKCYPSLKESQDRNAMRTVNSLFETKCREKFVELFGGDGDRVRALTDRSIDSGYKVCLHASGEKEDRLYFNMDMYLDDCTFDQACEFYMGLRAFEREFRKRWEQ